MKNEPSEKSELLVQAETELAKLTDEQFDQEMEHVFEIVNKLDLELSSPNKLLLVADRIAQMFDLQLRSEEYRVRRKPSGRPAGSVTMSNCQTVKNRAATYVVFRKREEFYATHPGIPFSKDVKDKLIKLVSKEFGVDPETIQEAYKAADHEGRTEEELFAPDFLPFLHEKLASIKLPQG